MKIQHYAGRQDPMIALFFQCARDAGLGFKAIATKSGVSESCLRRWENKTLRPQRLTLEFAFRACGFKMEVVRIHRGENVVPMRRQA